MAVFPVPLMVQDFDRRSNPNCPFNHAQANLTTNEHRRRLHEKFFAPGVNNRPFPSPKTKPCKKLKKYFLFAFGHSLSFPSFFLFFSFPSFFLFFFTFHRRTVELNTAIWYATFAYCSFPISMYVSRSSRRTAGRESRADCAGRCTASAVWQSVGSWRLSVSLVTGRTAFARSKRATWSCLVIKKTNTFAIDGRVGDRSFFGLEEGAFCQASEQQQNSRKSDRRACGEGLRRWSTRRYVWRNFPCSC